MTREEFENFCKCYFMPFSVDRQQAFIIGEQYGLTKADVMTIRKMAGFSSLNIKPKLTPAQREKMVREYERGKISLHNLAKKYGVSRVCVWYWVKRSRSSTAAHDYAERMEEDWDDPSGATYTYREINEETR